MRPNKKEQKLKRALQLLRELQELNVQKRQLPSFKLKEPIFKGWKKFFVVRDDLTRSPKAEALAAILKRINDTVYSDRKDFKVRIKGNRFTVKMPQLRHVYLYTLPNGKLRDEDQAWLDKYGSYFYRVNSCRSFRCPSECHCTAPHWHFTKPWMFDEVIEPHYLTHYTPS